MFRTLCASVGFQRESPHKEEVEVGVKLRSGLQ